LNSPPPPMSSLPPFEIYFNSFFSIYIHLYTVFGPYSPSYSLLPHPPPSHCYQTVSTCLSLLISEFTKERKKKFHFCLFKITTQRITLWHFHVYMYYSLIWFISSIFLLSTLVPFLWLFQQD
jgi:hypothetical protein